MRLLSSSRGAQPTAILFLGEKPSKDWKRARGAASELQIHFSDEYLLVRCNAGARAGNLLAKARTA